VQADWYWRAWFHALKRADNQKDMRFWPTILHGLLKDCPWLDYPLLLLAYKRWSTKAIPKKEKNVSGGLHF
jgi:hypothetical protein